MHRRRQTPAPLRRLAAGLAVAALGLSAVAQEAWADDAERLAELEQKAATEYEAKNYLAAIDLLVEANQLSPHPNYLLNIAVSYSKLGRCTEAREWATRAIKSDKPALPPEGTKVAQQVMDGCQELKTPPDDKKDPNEKDPKEPQAPPSEGPSALTITGWSFVGVGAGLFLGGLVWDQSIAGDIEEYNKLPNAQRTQDDADALTSDRSTMLVVTVLGGVLGVAGGSILLYESFGEAEPAPAAPTTLRLSPAFTHDGAGLLLDGRF